MTVIVQTPEQKYTADGVLTQFSFSFRLDAEADLQVYINQTLQLISADYSIDTFGPAGGSISFVLAPAGGSIVTLKRITPEDQQTDYQAYDAFPAETHERALDKLTMLFQELRNASSFIRNTLGLAWDALNLRITNVNDPQLPEDAVNQRSMENYVANNAPQGDTGPQGPIGGDGLVGPAGFLGPPGTATQWFTVTGVPATTLGVNGDYAINSNNGDFYARLSGVWVFQGNLQGPTIPAGGNDHSALINLTADDHAQYHNDVRGDLRYYTQAFLDPALAGKSAIGHSHLESDITNLDKYTQAQVDAFLAAKSNTGHTHQTTEVSEVPIRLITSSTTLVLADAGKKLAVDAVTSTILSVPTNAAVPYGGPVAILVRMENGNAVTISPNSGVTLRSFPNATGARIMSGAGAHIILHYRPDVAVNTWDLDGRLI